MDSKKCHACQVFKPYNEFWTDKSRPLDLKSKCKDCGKEFNSKNYAKNTEKIKANQREYSKTHREENNQYSKKYRKDNKKELQQKRKANRPKARAYRKKYTEKNPLKSRASHWITGIVQRAKDKNLVVDTAYFTRGMLIKWQKTQSHCPCCKIAFSFGLGQFSNKWSAPSLDRVDSSIGYTKDNTAMICVRCNTIKSNGTAAEHRNIADFIENWGGTS